MTNQRAELLKQIGAGVAISGAIASLAYWVFLLGYFYKKAYWAAFDAQDFYLFEASEGGLRLVGGFASLLTIILGLFYLLIFLFFLMVVAAVVISGTILLRKFLVDKRKESKASGAASAAFDWESFGQPKPIQYASSVVLVILFTQIIAETAGRSVGEQDHEKLLAAGSSSAKDLPPVRTLVLKDGAYDHPVRIMSCGENFCGVWNGKSVDVISKDNILSVTPYSKNDSSKPESE